MRSYSHLSEDERDQAAWRDQPPRCLAQPDPYLGPQIRGGGAFADEDAGAMVFPVVTLGRTEASATRTPAMTSSMRMKAYWRTKRTTGPEIWTQAGGEVDAWVAAVGSGATFIGVATALRQRNPRILCAAVEPAGCQPLAGLTVEKTRHLLQGTSYGSVPPHWDASLMDVSLMAESAKTD
jgi:hypothetical protein